MKSQLIKSFLLLLVFFQLLFATCQHNLQERTLPEATKGVLDLKDWDFRKDGPVNLTGEYELYWNQHLAPSEFTKPNPPQKSGFIEVPGYWNGYEVDGKMLFGEGYATYRLKIFLNEQRQSLALKLLDMGTAYKVYLNGKQLLSTGFPGQNRETTIPRYFPQVVDFESETNQIELIFQVSNFHLRRGGAWEVVQLGTEKEIRRIRERCVNFDLFLFGSIFIIALYHLGLFTLRRKTPSPLYFSIFCFLVSLRLLTTGERYLMCFFPNTSWELLAKLEYLSFYLSIPAFVLFMQSLFIEFSKRFLLIIVVVCCALSCLVLLTPARIFSHTLQASEIITLITAAYGLYVLILCTIRKRDGAFVFLLGFIILSLAGINDIMHVEKIIQTGHFAPFGLFVFIFSQAFLLSQRFSNVLATVETQRKKLGEVNEACRKEIMDRVQVEQALRESEEKYRTILHSIEEGYYEVDLAGDLTFCNDSLCKILGFSKNELLGLNNRDYMNEENARKVFRTFNRVYQTGEATKALDWETIRKDGTTRFVEASISLIRNQKDDPIGFRGIVRDITERREAEEQVQLQQQQLMQASKMVALGTLVSGVAHEINNPNNFIMLNAPLIKETWESAMPILEKYYQDNGDFVLGGMRYTEVRENFPRLFSGILDGSRRIKQIVEDLKNYVRNDLGDLTQSVDMNGILNSAVSLISNMIKKATNHFSIDYGENLPKLRGNFQRLEQVMINLIQNACQSLPNKDRGIFVSTFCDEGKGNIVVRVEDEGVGIRSDSLTHITDPFFTTKQDAGGVGLGLSISARIVEEHRGWMRFRSEPGKGTTAEVILPYDLSIMT